MSVPGASIPPAEQTADRVAAVLAVVQIDGRHLLGATNWIGREPGLHCTAAGKVFLAQVLSARLGHASA